MSKIIEEPVRLTSSARMHMFVEHHDGKASDTEITITGSFSVSGEDRAVFAEKLKTLINAYKI